ncbi:MAG: bacteriohemerythrin [archaeon]
MVFLKWSKELSVHMKEIDDQHKILIGLINSAYSIDKKSKDYKKKLGVVLNELVEFSRVHFSTEETYFQKFNYPFANEHIIAHEKLIIKVLQFKDRFDSKDEDILDDLTFFLTDWLKNHLMKHDFKYSKYFKEHGYI